MKTNYLLELRVVTILVVVLAVVNIVIAAPPPDDVIQKLTETIRKQCPEVKVEVAEYAFIAKHGTMIFTIHNESKGGEFYSQTYQTEGPNFKGFMLNISLYEGKYTGARGPNLTRQEPYFSNFFDAISTENGEKHYQVHFFYGSRIDPELKEAIFEAINLLR